MLKAAKYLGLSLVVLSFLMLIAFFATIGQGSESIASASGEPIHVPVLTDTIIYWGYILFAMTILVAVGVAFANFFKSLAANPGNALKSIIPVIFFFGIFVVSFLLGSGDRLSIIGYEGTQNEGIWAQLTDMFIYTTYTLLVVLIVAIFGARIYTSLK